jgi:hypothetical protein
MSIACFLFIFHFPILLNRLDCHENRQPDKGRSGYDDSSALNEKSGIDS